MTLNRIAIALVLSLAVSACVDDNNHIPRTHYNQGSYVGAPGASAP